MKFRKKPVVVDAIQFSGARNFPKVLDFILDGHADYSHLPVSLEHGKRGVALDTKTGALRLPTLEGVMTCFPGDWVVRGVEGEFYPVRDSIFQATYEGVEEKAAA